MTNWQTRTKSSLDIAPLGPSAPRVVVTGASRGIGRAIAIECARRGAIVGANYLRSREDAESLQALFPDRIHLLPFDVRDPVATEAALDGFAEACGSPDVLVNNAGIGGRPQFLIRLSTTRLEEIATTNLLGAVYATKAALKHMSKARKGHVLYISSISAATPLEGMTIYAATKAGVEAMAMCVAKEYANRGVTAHGVRFGLVRTDMTRTILEAMARSDAAAEAAVHDPEDAGAFIADLVFGHITPAAGTTVTFEPEPRREVA